MAKPKIHKKKYIGVDVYTKAIERLEYLYDSYEDVIVSFSGGKDSTALLLCAIDAATKKGKLPVKAVFYDEEAIHPPTIEYVKRVREMPEVDLEWYCLPVMHRNACSNEQPFWHCWNPDEKDLWVREMPEFAITEHPRFKWGMTMQDWGTAQFKNTNKVVVQGIRTEESIRRYMAVARKKHENYITKPENGVYFAYPIYDWSSEDVWKLVQIKNADYNKTYDIFNQTAKYNKFLGQRVCPPFGEEPLRGLHFYAECFPEMWSKMIDRVKGARTAALYGNTELYSQGFKPEGVSYREHIENTLLTYNAKDRVTVSKNLNSMIKSHRNKTDDPIPIDMAHPLTGVSWRLLSKTVTRGDFKGRIRQTLVDESKRQLDKMGITVEEAQERYGKRQTG